MAADMPSGKFADLNCITKKTLRLWREMGLIEPKRVDAETGYGYYGLSQCSTIDMIQQLRDLGFSLAEIKSLENNGQRGLAHMLERRLDALDEEILRLLIARQNTEQLLVNCRWCHHGPLYDTPILEHLPARRMMVFDVQNPDAVHLSEDAAAFMEQWELNLRATKRLMLDQGLPSALFHHVGCRIGRADLERRAFDLNASWIFVEEERVAERYGAGFFPAGDYLTMYKRSYSEKGRNTEVIGLNALLDYAELNGFSVAGDYYGQIIAETPAFHFTGREMLFKLMLPIRLA